MFGFILLLIVGGTGFLLFRAGARPPMIAFLLIGMFVPLSIAFAAWFLSTPPIWTLVAPRTDATLQVVDVREPRDGARFRGPDVVDIRVRLEGERSGRLLPLYGMELPEGVFQDRLEYQQALREMYPVGSTYTVRLSRDVAYADRQDWFASAAFAFCVMFAVLMIGITLFIVSATAGRSRAGPHTPP